MRQKLVPLALVLLGLGSPLQGQVYSSDPFRELGLPQERPPGRQLALPPITLELEVEIPLPGPLPGESPVVVDGHVEIPVAGGLARVAPEAGATPRLEPRSTAQDGDADSQRWVYSPSRTRRFSAQPRGLIIGQRCCSWFREGWRRVWKLKIPGGTPAPPLVLNTRVFVGALDNQIYALRSRNGHRLWTLDVGERISGPLALWSGPLPTRGKNGAPPRAQETELILVIPDSGARLVALDPVSGNRVASFTLPESDGRLVGAAATTTEGKLVVARQKYAESEASLMVFRVRAGTPPAN